MAIGREPVISIEGTVSEVVYMSPETGFAVIEVETDEELLPVVGELYGVSEGEELRLTGSYSNHPKFGRQFKAMAYERRMPATAAAATASHTAGDLPSTERNPDQPPPALPTAVANLPMPVESVPTPFVTLPRVRSIGPAAAA